MRKLLMMVMGLMMLTTSACSNPFKVTDPSDPKFNPEEFQFEDYPGIPPMTDALKKLFPVDTPKKFVEKVLIEAGGAKLDTVLPAAQIEKNNKSWKRATREQECALMMPVRDYYIYTKFPDYIFPSFPNRVWNVGVQYDEENRVTLVQLNGRPISGTINCEELR